MEVFVMEKKYYEQAQKGLELLNNSIIGLLSEFPNGLSNTEISSKLGIHSEHNESQKDYLAYSLLGNLMKENKVEKGKERGRTFYKIKKQIV
jgi:hypothetical protein